MSELRRGVDTRLGRDVMVKIFRGDLARDPQLQLRLQRAAQNAVALNHPAIVAVYDTGEVRTDFGNLLCLVMEHVDGHTLREIIKTQGPMTQDRAIEVMADVCTALDFSHKRNILHRDVKPANIMINGVGEVRVMGFGIARNSVIGTAHYLSPEQARGEAADARSDIYATGCVLFELLTGKPPFAGDSPVAVAYQHVREDPHRPSDLNPSVSSALDAVVLKALSKNLANRYQSAAEMRADLIRAKFGRQPLAPKVLIRDKGTALPNAGSTRPTPQINGPGTHEAPLSALLQRYNGYRGYKGEPGIRTRRLVAIDVVAAVIVGFVLLTAYLIFNVT